MGLECNYDNASSPSSKKAFWLCLAFPAGVEMATMSPNPAQLFLLL
jgi:hypothetical protein